MLICATVTSPAETLAILKNKLSSIFEYGLYSRDSVAHPPRYGDQIEERVTLLIGCVEQVLGFSLPENLVNPLRKHFGTDRLRAARPDPAALLFQFDPGSLQRRI